MPPLVLHVRRKYFDAIVRGEKTEEFRRCTPYWRKRLEGRVYDGVLVACGYPSFERAELLYATQWRGYRVTTITHPEFGPAPVQVYAIRLR